MQQFYMLLIKHHASKMYVGVEVQFHTFVSLTLEEGVNTVPLLPSSSLHQHPDQELG
jgi:hypothetical protein